MTEGCLTVLDIVVERPIDISDPPAGQSHEAEPMVVVLLAGWLREWQGEIEQVPAKQRGGARHGVGDQERGQIVVVVGPLPQ